MNADHRDILIGIDAGTSVIKSVAFNVAGEQVAVAARPNHYVTHRDGGAEQDMARTFEDMIATLSTLTAQIPNLAERLIAISVTGQGDGMWLVDANGDPVAPAWLWLDARASAIAEEFSASPDYAAHYARTGTGVNVCQQSIHLAWMARNRPAILARATTSMHCKDWLYFKLTDKRATDPSEANFTFGNYQTRAYQPEILNALRATEAIRLLPPIVEGTETSHALSQTAAKATGLKAGTPVCLGYVDVICTGLGGGLYDPTGHSGCTIVGSTGMHMRLRSDPSLIKLNAEKSGYTMCFPVQNTVAQIQSNMASTLNIDWLLDLARGVLSSQGIDRTRGDLLKDIDEKILQSKPASLIYHPYISLAGERGPFMDPAARASFVGLDVNSTYFDMMRAVFEGLSFAARDCYAAMGDIPKEIRVTGGAARSQALRQILASVLNAPVRTVQREEAGAAGAAMMAAVQQKRFSNMAECAGLWVTPHLGEATIPDAAIVPRYATIFETYKTMRKDLRPHWRAMKGTP